MSLRVFFFFTTFVSFAVASSITDSLNDNAQFRYANNFADPTCVKENLERINEVVNNMKTCMIFTLRPTLQAFMQSNDYAETIVNSTCSDTPKQLVYCISKGLEDLVKICESKMMEKGVLSVINTINYMVDYACSHKQQFKDTAKATNMVEFSSHIENCVESRKDKDVSIFNGNEFKFDAKQCKNQEQFLKCLIGYYTKQNSTDFVKNLFLAGAKATSCEFNFDK